MIRKHGTEDDKLHLPEISRFNRPRKSNGRKRSQLSLASTRSPTWPSRNRSNRQRLPLQGAIQQTRNDSSNAFNQAFPDAAMTPYMQARDQEVREEVQRHNEEYEQEARQERRAGSDLYIISPPRDRGVMQRNYGDVSRTSRQRYGEQISNAVEALRQQIKVAAAKEAGLCSIIGCSYPALHHDHPCRGCGAGVHGLCAVENQLTGGEGNENVRYCSLTCKNSDM